MEFTFLISPYQMSKIEGNLNFKLSQVPQIAPLLQKLALKFFARIKAFVFINLFS